MILNRKNIKISQKKYMILKIITIRILPSFKRKYQVYSQKFIAQAKDVNQKLQKEKIVHLNAYSTLQQHKSRNLETVILLFHQIKDRNLKMFHLFKINIKVNYPNKINHLKVI